MAPDFKPSQGANHPVRKQTRCYETLKNLRRPYFFQQELAEYINTFEHGNCVMGERQIQPNSKHGIKT